MTASKGSFPLIDPDDYEDVPWCEYLEPPKERMFKAAGQVIPRYALTFNINEYEKINGRQWYRYRYEQQVGILTRMILAYGRIMNFVIPDKNMYFEKTKNGVAHLHCAIDTYENAESIQQRINAQRKRIVMKDGDEYLACYIKSCFNHPGWYLYITKDQ